MLAREKASRRLWAASCARSPAYQAIALVRPTCHRRSRSVAVVSRWERRQHRLATMSEDDQLESLRRLAGYLHVWNEALELQHQRLRQQSVMTGGPDTWRYAVALGTCLRCVGLADDLGVDTAPAVSAFDSAVPDAKAVRDVLEHLEDYELGVGDLQQGPAIGRRLEFLYCSSDSGMSFIELQGVDVRLDLLEAHQAAQHLLADVADAVARAVAPS